MKLKELITFKFNNVNKITISRNIIEASATGNKYHVISRNEIHSFNNKNEAKKDLAFGKRVIARHTTDDTIELLTQQQIEALIS